MWSIKGREVTGAEQDKEKEKSKQGDVSSAEASLCEKAVGEILQSLTELKFVRPGQSLKVRKS